MFVIERSLTYHRKLNFTISLVEYVYNYSYVTFQDSDIEMIRE